MADAEWLRQQAAVSLARLWPRLDAVFGEQTSPEQREVCEARLRREWERLFGLLIALYGDNYDFFYHLEQLLLAAGRSWLARPDWLKQLDIRRETEPDWFQSQGMVGGVLYVDLFSGNLASLRTHLPYFKQL